MRRVSIGLFCVAALLVSGVVLSQGVTTGALKGVVVDPNQDPVAGASVTAVLTTTGTRYTTSADAEGRFSIANVVAGGPYTVTISMPGFRTQEKTDVFVRLGEVTALDFELNLEAVTGEIAVVGESNPLINPSRMGAASNVTERQIEELPTISRSLQDFARTNPLISIIPDQDGASMISVAGRNNRYNNIQIDGAVNNDVFGLAATGTPGGQTETQPISLDALQELQLVISPFDVRQGGFSGGGINAITRSGSNQFRGSVYGYYRDDSLVGDGPKDFPELGTFDEKQYGFRLGGPILRDKAFFFVNAEISRLNQPTGWSIDGAAGQQYLGGTAIGAAERFVSLLGAYGYDPGGLSQQIRPTDSDKVFASFDFNIADNHRLKVRHNYVDASKLINYPDYDFYEFPNNAYDMKSKTNSTVAQLNSVLSDSMFNEARLTYQTIRDRRHGIGQNFPSISIQNVDGDYDGFGAGTEAYSTHNSLDQDIIELTDDFTFFKGDHEITVGTHNEFYSFKNLFLQNGYGAYQFPDLDAFEAGMATRYDYTYSADPDPYDKFNVQQLGFYGGDKWSVRPNLTVTYGLRVDIPLFPDKPAYNPLVDEIFGYRTDQVPNGNAMWSPRVGFNWDVDGNGTQQLRGGVGLFSGRTPYVWISNNYGRTGIEQVTISARGDIPFNPDPYNQPTDIGGASTQDINVVDPDFQFPQVWRANLAYDRELPWWNLVGTVEVVASNVQKDILYQDLNIEPSGDVLPFDGRPIYETVSRTFSGAYLLTNTDEGHETNALIKLERRYGHGIWGFIAYNWGESKVITDGTSSRAVSNFQYNESPDPNHPRLSTSDFSVEHRFTASLSYEFNPEGKWSTQVSAYYNAQSGRPYTAIYVTPYGSGGSINNDWYFYNDPIYIPSGPDDVVITNGTWEQLDGWISSAGLSDYKGKIAPRNGSRAPWTHSLDLHVGQDIPVGYGNLQVTLDVFNFMNLIDSNAGHVRYVPFGTVSPVTYLGTSDAGKPIYELRYMVTDPENNPPFNLDNLRSRWQAKLGLRYSF